jgi:ligand-binding sensor domain-containing protein/DNA-binding CsgD family transcriptional regulator
MSKKFFLILFFLFLILQNYADINNIGVPYIHSYTKSEYKAGTQDWQIGKNSKNFMYFANNNGLLEFDGSRWQLYGLPNPSIIRCLEIDQNDRIYVGQQNDFGYLDPDNNGHLKFHSLLDQVPPDDRNFEEIWKIHLTSFGVVFQSYTHVFIYRDDHLIPLRLKNRIWFSFYVNGKLFIQDVKEGLMEYQHNELVALSGVNELKDKRIWAMLPISSSRILIATAKNGVFIYDGQKLTPWQGEANEFLEKNQLFSATRFNDTYYALGTVQNGILITDENGKVFQHINKRKGLQNNTVLSIGTDRDENLWLGLDNGIDFVDISSPITYMFNPEGLGATYTSVVFNGKLYVGTNHGLFVKNWPESSSISAEGFRFIPQTVGQVWYLGIHQGELLCGHDNGTFLIEGEKATQISSTNGAWMFIEPIQNKNYLIGGNYLGLTLFKTGPDHKWQFFKQIRGFSESSKLLAQDKHGNIWMSHGFKGVFRISLNEKLDSVVGYKFYNSAQGLPSDLYNNLMTIGENIIYTTQNGIYTYHEATDRFERSEYYNNLLEQQTNIDYVKEDQYSNIWYSSGTNIGVMRRQEDGTYTRVSASFEKLSGRIISGFENINVVDPQNTFIALEDGLAHYSPNYQYATKTVLRSYIREVINLKNQRTIYPALLRKSVPEDSLAFAYQGNHLEFRFSSPDYTNLGKIRFSYYLENFSKSWSPWSEKATCEFMNLPEGTYQFLVKATDPFDNESDVASFTFSIIPPWYRSNLFYLLYFLSALILAGLFAWFIYYRIQISKRKERLKNLQEYRKKVQQYQREALISEKEIIKLRNEQLHIEMIHRDKELANQTMDLIRKNKFLTKIKQDLEHLRKSTSDEALKDKISSLVHRIDRDVDHKKQWEVFETAFDEVHEDFLSRLKAQYPTLTPKELRLCAYLRLNISTKEIAPLMNISVRGVEICRYRVRKKLEISRDENLTKFIIDY